MRYYEGLSRFKSEENLPEEGFYLEPIMTRKTVCAIFFLLFFSMISFLNIGEAADTHFKDHKRSLIQWKELDHKEWLSFKKWKEEYEKREKFPPWERLKRERSLKERVGYVVDCKGECFLYRGLGKNKIQFKSTVREGDEIQTKKDSYLWLFLMDGTMVRVSPQTSLTMREINISPNEVFLHARINFGNVLWLSREGSFFDERSERETDALFHPHPLYEVLPKLENKKIDENDLFSYLEEDSTALSQYKRLNVEIKKNNPYYQSKKSIAFLVMPNGTLFGERLKVELIVLLGGETFLKRRTFKELGFKEKSLPESLLAEVFLRGYENKKGNLIEEGQWYEIDKNGSSLRVLESNEYKRFLMGEFLTQRIPTIFLGREVFLRRYSTFIFNNELTSKQLALLHGYRLWRSWNSKKKEMKERVDYLKEYTRRVETTVLKESLKLRQRLIKRKERVHPVIYDNRFYKKAMESYYKSLAYPSSLQNDKEVLNSTRHPFWGKVKVYGK